MILLPLGSGRPVRLHGEPFFFWHTLNAFDAPEGPVVDVVGYPDFSSEAWLGALPHRVPERAAPGTLQRIRIDLSAGRFTPQVSPRWACRPQSLAYVTSPSNPEAARGVFDGLAKVDLRRGRARRFALEPETYPSEPVFVPRPGATGEDDGWLLSLVYEPMSDLSHVAVLDARVPDLPPLARVELGARVPFAFHGRFASRDGMA